MKSVDDDDDDDDDDDAIFLQCFDTVGWVIWPVKTRPRYDL